MVEAGEEQRQDCSSGTEETTEDSTRPGQEEPFGPARLPSSPWNVRTEGRLGADTGTPTGTGLHALLGC